MWNEDGRKTSKNKGALQWAKTKSENTLRELEMKTIVSICRGVPNIGEG